MLDKNHLFRIGDPSILLSENTAADDKWMPQFLYRHAEGNTFVRVLRGNKMRTTQALMNEFGAALQFFDGFGENWDALSECLCYLDETFPGHDAYVIVIIHADEVLVDQNEDWLTLIKCLTEAGEWWSKPINDNDRFNRPPIPMRIVFKYPKDQAENIKRRLNKCQYDILDPKSIEMELL